MMAKPPPQRVPQKAWQRIMESNPDEGVQPLTHAKKIDINLIHTDPRQPRKHFEPEAMAELIASVKSRGILQPITVQRRPEGGFFVVTGERRLRAAREAELAMVPALVVELDETQLRLDRVIENRQRADLTDVEFAHAVAEIREDLGRHYPDISSNELDEIVGARLGLSGRTIRNFAAVLNLDPSIEALLGDKLTEVRTRGLVRIGYDPAMQRALAEAILEHDLSGRQTLAAAQMLKRNLGLSVAEAVERVLGRAALPAAPVVEEPAAPAVAPAPTQPGIEGLEAGFDLSDPQRRYWLLTTYLSRAGAILAEAGADDEVPLNRQQVGDLALLLEPLSRLHVTLMPAIEYIARKMEAGDAGYDGEPLPHPLAVMLPYGGPPSPPPSRALHAVPGAGRDAERSPAPKSPPRLRSVPKK
jgi:ParB/RepB/Spo0J family partition protein